MSEPFVESIYLKRGQVRSFDVWPYSIPAIQTLGELKFHPKATYFIGENGSGKSTLLEAIARLEGFNAEGGSRNFHFASRGDWPAGDLAWALGIRRGPSRLKGSDGFFFRAESFFNVATEVDRLAQEPGRTNLLNYYGGTSLHAQSHGESFLSLFVNRFSGNGLYLMDEPESALSPQRQLSFLAAMHDLIGRGAQMIITTHSPILMAYPEATIYEFSERGIREIAYEETQNYRVTKAFLTRREQMLRELLDDSAD